MKKSKVLLGLFGVTTIMASLLLQLLPPSMAFAAQITNRSLTLQAGATDGGSKPGGIVNHLFSFTVPDTTDPVGSIRFQYCTTAADVGASTCVTPTGLSTTAATLGTQSGATFSSLDTSTAGAPYVSRVAAAIAAPGQVTIQLLNVTNPTTPQQTFYVRISTYGSTDASGTALDTGTVAASTANPIQLSGTMPESLVFCTGATVGTTNGVPDCTLATAGTVSFNQLFSPTDTASATSQMAASTNAGSGYAVTVNGPTLTSGSNTITAMGTADTSKFGISQFGINLVANTTPAVGTVVAPALNGTNYNGQPKPASGYDVANTFKFNNGDAVANSNNLGTDAQIFTASYIVNVPGSQPAGTYTTTLTYICTPTF